jgi:hypothetical protein
MGLFIGLFGRSTESTTSSSTASASSTSSSASFAPSSMESCSSSSSTGIASMSKSSSLTSGSPKSSGSSTWNRSTTDNNNSSPNSSSDVDSGPWAPYPKSAQLTPHYAFHPLTHKLAYLERQRSATKSAEEASLFSFGTHTRKGMRKGGLGTCENEVRVVSSLLCMR